MRRGTTPTHIFSTGIDLSSVSVLWLTYQQGDTAVTKTLSDITIDPEDSKKFSVTLTQSETLAFDSGQAVSVQLRVLLADGTAMASNVQKIDVGNILKDGEIA